MHHVRPRRQEEAGRGSSRASTGAASRRATTCAPIPPTARPRRAGRRPPSPAGAAGSRQSEAAARSSLGRALYWTLRARRLGPHRARRRSSPTTRASFRRSTSSRCPKRPPNIAILADDGSLIANRGDTGGPAVRLIDLPPYLPKAFVAIEDRRFYSHFGIDPVGISRAVVRDVTGGGRGRGRLDPDPAARQEPVPHPGADDLAQDPGGDPRALARAQILQGPDPRALSQPGLFRLGRLRGRGRVAEIFRQERPLRHRCRRPPCSRG